jgi:hypothetical protein
LRPGKPANRLSAVLASSSADAGKRRMVYLQITPFLPEDVLDS